MSISHSIFFTEHFYVCLIEDEVQDFHMMYRRVSWIGIKTRVILGLNVFLKVVYLI